MSLIGSPDHLLEQVAGRVRREVVLARFIGKFAVDQGLRELQKRLDPKPEPMAPNTVTDTVSVFELKSASSDEVGFVATGTALVEPDDLALADYDHLSSAQIVSKLDDLEPDDRERIGAYEQSHRRRRTILGKIQQLGAE